MYSSFTIYILSVEHTLNITNEIIIKYKIYHIIYNIQYTILQYYNIVINNNILSIYMLNHIITYNPLTWLGNKIFTHIHIF